MMMMMVVVVVVVVVVNDLRVPESIFFSDSALRHFCSLILIQDVRIRQTNNCIASIFVFIK